MKSILLSFDIEEFDLPREYNVNIENEFEISYEGTKKILDVLNKNNVKATFFVTTSFAEKYPKLIKKISEKHEIGLHGLKHSDNYNKDEEAFNKLKKAKEIIETIIDKKIKGFRAPRYQHPDYKLINKLEILYDSSCNPTYIPGRYNNFFKTRKESLKENVKIIPLSVYPVLRLPLFWLFFRNLSLIYSKLGTRLNKKFVCLVFHPWEFVDLKDFKIPFLIKRNTGNKLELKLDKYIKWCLKKNYTFKTMEDYLSKTL